MIRFLIERPTAIFMIFIALVLLGIVSITKVPISPLPNINIPQITIHVSKPGYSASELETTVVQNLRSQLKQLNGLKDINSETRDGYAIIKLQFNYNSNINFAFIETNDKIDIAMKSFPRDIERPRVIKSNISDIPVFYIDISLKNKPVKENISSFQDLSNFSSQVIKRRLEQLQEVAFVDMTGITRAEVSLQPKPEVLRAINLSENEMKRIIDDNDLTAQKITVRDGVTEFDLNFANQSPGSLEAIKNLRFVHNNRILRLSDVADIAYRQEKPVGEFISDNKKAVSLAIIKQPEAKMEDLRVATAKLIQSFESDYPAISFKANQDQSELLEFSINNLKQDLFYGSLLAFIMMFLFLKNIRSPLLIGLTIPIGLLLSILLFNLFHLTINIISLSGLILGVGLMIDNSIIVIDNITQKRIDTKKLREACVIGTTEIITPLLSSALTTCSVFIPLIFLSGISGALFYDQAMAIVIGLTSSLSVSIILLPILYLQVHSVHWKSVKLPKFNNKIETVFIQLYEGGFNWVFSNKKLTFVLVFLLILINIPLFLYLPKEKLPGFEKSDLNVQINWNEAIPVKDSHYRTEKLISSLKPFIEFSNATIAEQQYLLNQDKELSSSQVLIYLKKKAEISTIKLKQKIRGYLASFYPRASCDQYPPKTLFERVFGEDQAPLILKISRLDDDSFSTDSSIDNLAKTIKQTFPTITLTMPSKHKTISLVLNYDKLLRYNLSQDLVYQTLKTALTGNEIGNFKDGMQKTAIKISDSEIDLNYIMHRLLIRDGAGNEYPFSNFVTLKKEESYERIFGGAKGTYIPIQISTDHPQQIVNYLKTKSSDPNLQIEFTGSFFSNQTLIIEMTSIFFIVLLLLYFILAAQFESLIQPLIVLFEIPISMSGSLLILLVCDSSINLISLIGLVVMCGIIINDSILKIDTINNLWRSGQFTLENAIHNAGHKRIKSIIMTSMTTILSVTPFLFGNDIGSTLQRPLSLALIGGMIIGTPVSLYFIPLLYWFYYRNKPVELPLITP